MASGHAPVPHPRPAPGGRPAPRPNRVAARRRRSARHPTGRPVVPGDPVPEKPEKPENGEGFPPGAADARSGARPGAGVRLVHPDDSATRRPAAPVPHGRPRPSDSRGRPRRSPPTHRSTPWHTLDRVAAGPESPRSGQSPVPACPGSARVGTPVRNPGQAPSGNTRPPHGRWTLVRSHRRPAAEVMSLSPAGSARERLRTGS